MGFLSDAALYRGSQRPDCSGGQKVILTRAGEGLFRYVSEIYQHMPSAEKFLESLKDGSLRVGISSTFSPAIVRAAAAFEETYPHVKLIIKNASSFEVADEVYNSEVDLGIVVGVNYGNKKLKRVELSPREKLVLVTSPASTLCQKERVRVLELCGYPMILGPETSAPRHIILSRLRLDGCHMPALIIVEVNNLDWGMNLIKRGKGMSVFHDRDVKDEIAEGCLKALSLNDDIWVGDDVLVRENAPESLMVTNFISLVKEALISQN